MLKNASFLRRFDSAMNSKEIDVQVIYILQILIKINSLDNRLSTLMVLFVIPILKIQIQKKQKITENAS